MHYATRYTQYLQKLQENNTKRILKTKAPNISIDFSSNDYLQLSQNKNCIQKGYELAQMYGMGATGSRLLSGNIPEMQEFEQRIAHDKNTESALLFATGYQANSAVLPALINSKVLEGRTLIICDKRNHASLYTTIFSGAEYKRFIHNTVEHLHDILRTYAHQYNNIFLIVESIYGMDGTIAPLAEYIALAKEYTLFLYIDEAHATGVFGEKGYGLCTEHSFEGVEYCIMGTMSKALGGMGAYIASSKSVIEYCINACGGFIYSTAPSPFIIGAMKHAWELLPSLWQERKNIFYLSTLLRNGIKDYGYTTTEHASHIVPLIHSSQEYVQNIYTKLIANGIQASFIRTPTVPANAPRLRFALNAKHRQEDIFHTLEIIRTCI